MTFSRFFLTFILLGGGGSQGECWCLSQLHTGKSRIVTSSLVLYEHLEVWELAKRTWAKGVLAPPHTTSPPFCLELICISKRFTRILIWTLIFIRGMVFFLKEEVILYSNVHVCVSQGQESPTSTPSTPSQSLCSDDVWDSISPGLLQEHDSVVALLSHNGDWWDSSCSLHFVYNWN